MEKIMVLLLMSYLCSVSKCEKTKTVKVSDKQRCQLQGIRLDVKLPGCIPVQVDISTCLGACLSFHAPHDSGEHVRDRLIPLKENVHICKVSEYVEITVALECRLHKKYHIVKSATKCDCQKCL